MEEQQYWTLLESLHDSMQGNETNEKPVEVEDKDLSQSTVSQNKEQDIEYDRRNKLYTELLGNYIERYQKKEKVKSIYKGIFFSATMLLFLGIEACCLIGMVSLSIRGEGNLASVGIAVSNIVGLVSTLIVLPKIIAEHLFPTNEENNMIDMVKNMQDNDAGIRKVIYGEKTEEQK